MLYSNSSLGQGVPKKCIALTTYDSMLVYIAEGNQAVIDAETYKKSAEALRVEVDRKEQVIVKQLDLKWNCLRLVDTLKAQGMVKDEIIETQASTIKKLGTKPKYWNIGLGIGYGYSFGSEVRRAPFAGIILSRSLFRF